MKRHLMSLVIHNSHSEVPFDRKENRNRYLWECLAPGYFRHCWWGLWKVSTEKPGGSSEGWAWHALWPGHWLCRVCPFWSYVEQFKGGFLPYNPIDWYPITQPIAAISTAILAVDRTLEKKTLRCQLYHKHIDPAPLEFSVVMIGAQHKGCSPKASLLVTRQYVSINHSNVREKYRIYWM